MPTPSMPLRYNEPRKTVFPSAPRAADNAGMSNTIQGVREKSDHSQAGDGSVGCSETEDKKLLEALRQSKLYRDYERTFTEATRPPTGAATSRVLRSAISWKEERKSILRIPGGEEKLLRSLSSDAGAAERSAPGHRAFTSMSVRSDRDRGAGCSWRAGYRLSLHRPGLHEPNERQKHANHEACGPFLKQPASHAEGLRLWKQTRSIETGQYKATVQLLSFFAKQLSTLSNQLCIEQKSEEPAVVTRARQFIAENRRKPITLAHRGAGIRREHVPFLHTLSRYDRREVY